eukprot:1701688-Karenia_brevis.AAC.1
MERSATLRRSLDEFCPSLKPRDTSKDKSHGRGRARRKCREQRRGSKDLAGVAHHWTRDEKEN